MFRVARRGDAGGQWNGGHPARAPKQGGKSGQYPQIEGPDCQGYLVLPLGIQGDQVGIRT